MEVTPDITLGRKRVFVVDDDAAVRESMIKVLKGVGYDVVTASDGEEASRHFVPDKCDLVLLDLNLPLRSGWDVFEHLTTHHPTIPVIIITAMPNQFRTALAAGAGALMEKPIEVPVLLNTMEALLTEPPEARLRRMCGYQQDTKHFRPSNAVGAGVLRSSVMKLSQKHKLQPG
jgi:DNA-binding response OmpR family regulator